MKECVLFSGGIDSYITWLKVGQPDTIFVDLGHKYGDIERQLVKQLIPQTQILDLPLGQFEKPDAEIPLRNMYLAMAAVNLGYDMIWLTVQKDELSIPDRTPLFFNHASSMLSTLSGRSIKVDTPWWDVDKVGMIEWYLNAGYSTDLLKTTWACYHPNNGKPCANCGACFRRCVAMSLAGVHEEWHDQCFNNPISETYYERAKSGSTNGYSENRANRIVQAVEAYRLSTLHTTGSTSGA